jgi:hypothetical protein
MEHRPNSGPEQSTPIGQKDMNRVLQTYIMHRALIRWEGPRHSSFITLSAWLISLDFTWPREGKPSPEELRAAGFFYVDKYLIISVTDDGGASVPLLRFIYYDCSQVGGQQTGQFVSIWVAASRTG